jgi:c-di-GMP-binding flagellar brake protein YcgR
MTEERRNRPRIRVSHPVVYFTNSYPNSMLALTVDLSTGGAGIETPYSVRMGEKLKISIGISSQLIKCRGRVVHILRSKGEGLKAGVQFEDLSKKDTLYLTKYVSCVMKQQEEHRSLTRSIIELGSSLLRGQQ